MRILFLTELSHVGGVDTFLHNLIRNWPRPADELILLANPGCPGLKMLRESLAARARVESHGITVYGDVSIRLGMGRFGRLVSAVFLRPIMMAHCFASLRSLFKRLNPDRVMLVAGGFPGGDTIRLAALAWTSVRRDRPYATLNLHNLVKPVRRWQFTARAFDRWFARRCFAIVSVSAAGAASVSLRPGLTDGSSVRHILNGLSEPDRTNLGDVRADFGLPSDVPVVAMLSTYEARKGHVFMLNAFRIALNRGVDAVLIICGQGSAQEMHRVRALVAELGLNGKVLLSEFRPDARRLLSVAALVAVPSQFAESLPYVAIEALSFGVPVVATQIGGLPEVIADGQGGWCVSPTDVNEFARRMHDLLTDPQLRRAQSEQGRLRFERLFSSDRMAREYAAMIV